MVGSPFNLLDRGGVGALVSRVESLSGAWFAAFASVSAGVFWSSVVVASFLWLLLNDRIQPAVVYCLRLFLVA